MALVYQGIAFLAALAVSIWVYADTGSLVAGFAAYVSTGTLVLFGVFLSAVLRQRAEQDGRASSMMYVAE